MKLIRFGRNGQEKPGLELDNGSRIDVSAFGEDYNELFFGSDGPNRLAEWLDHNESQCAKIAKNIDLDFLNFRRLLKIIKFGFTN